VKLKYYLRGLGVGIIASTIILLVTFSGHKSSLTNQQIIDRAQKLGMVMSDTKSGNAKEKIPKGTETEKQSTETSSAERLKSSEANNAGTETEKKNTAADTATQTTADNSTASTPATNNGSEQSNTKNQEESVQIQINAGDSSDRVADTLYKSGLVDSAQKFNSYLEKQGYDRKLKTGTYSIKKGMSYSQVISSLLKKGN